MYTGTLADRQWMMACVIVVFIKASHRRGGGALPHDRCRHVGGTVLSRILQKGTISYVCV